MAPVAYFSGKHIEAVFQILALFCLRYKFHKTYHADTTMTCTFLTLSIGYLAIPRVRSVSLALFSGVVVSFIIAFLSWAAQEFVDRKKRISELESAPTAVSIPYSSCSREEFDMICASYGVKPSRNEYVWDLLRSKLSTADMMDKYCIEEKTVIQDRWRYRKKFANPIDSGKTK